MVGVHGDEVRRKYATLRAAQADALCTFGIFDRERGWEVEGAVSAVSWLAEHAHLTRAGAAREVAAARLVADYPEIAVSVQSDTIAPAHVAELAALARHRSNQFRASAPFLAEAARNLTPEDFRTVARHWRVIADDHTPHTERAEAGWVDFSATFAGSWSLNGMFDPARGAAIDRALGARSAPTSADDERTAAQRRADALYELITGADTVAAHVDVIVDVGTLIGEDQPLESVRRELAGVGAIERLVFERLACDAHVGRVLMRGSNEVLNLGRRVRVASPAQRRAVTHRDGGCVWPGCCRPAPMCEVHHIVPWWACGPSDLDNLAMLCGRHHAAVHRGWKLARHPDGTWDAVPP